MRPLLQRVGETILRYSMLPGGSRLGVAVSGGADSVCLLHVLHQLGAQPTVVHLNHQLRGADSDADAEFVVELAKNLDVPSVIQSVDAGAIPGNLEQAGRNARMALFSSLLQTGKLDRIATAHTRSDQAETVLYRLIRGSGTTGLAGIAPATAEGIIRPLIDIDRREVIEFLTSRGIAWREDSTNADTRFVRNRIRRELIPVLETYNPEIAGTLARMAGMAADEEAYWASEIKRVAAVHSGFPRLNVEFFRTEMPAVQRRLIRASLTEVRGNLRSIDANHIEAIRELALCREGRSEVALPGCVVRRSFGTVSFDLPVRAGEFDYELTITLPGDAALPGRDQRVHFQLLDIASVSASGALGSGYNENGHWIDADRLTAPLVLRNWKPGDAIERESGARRKLKTMFQRARVPVWERSGWPVMTCGGEVAWTRQFGVSARFAPTSATRRVVVVSEGR